MTASLELGSVAGMLSGMAESFPIVASSPGSADEAGLLVRLRAGDDVAFEELVVR